MSTDQEPGDNESLPPEVEQSVARLQSYDEYGNFEHVSDMLINASLHLSKAAESGGNPEMAALYGMVYELSLQTLHTRRLIEQLVAMPEDAPAAG